MTTIVSAFLSNINYNSNINSRGIDDYIIKGKKLIEIKVNKVIFIEKEIVDLYKLKENDYTKFIYISFEDLLYSEQSKKIQKIYWSDCYEKDTLEYMVVQCNKTEFIRKSIEFNPYNSKQFIWLDFGIYKFYIDNDLLFSEHIDNLTNQSYDGIRIASCYSPGNHDHNIWTMVRFYFAGTVFGGDKNTLLKFADYTKDKCLWFINERNTLIWEVNIWYLIFEDLQKENKQDLFSYYLCNHDTTLLENY